MNQKPARGSYLRFVVILGALTAVTPLSIDMYLPAMPAMQAYFSSTSGEIGATLAVFFGGFALGQSVIGPLSDRFGRRVPMTLGIAVFIIASGAAAVAPDVESLIAARFFQALGGCAGVVISRAMVRDLFDERTSAKAYSALILVMGVAPILGPLIGGYLIAYFEWQAIFWLLAVFGFLCLMAVVLGVGETLPIARRSKGGLAGVMRGYYALLRDRDFMALALASGFAISCMFAYITGSPFVFIELHGVAPQNYGLLFGANALGLIAASQINTWLLGRFSARGILAMAVRTQVLAACVLVGIAALNVGGLVALLPPMFVAVASLGLIMPNAMAAAMVRAQERAGAASALLGVIQFSLAAVAGALVGVLHDGSALPMTGTMAFLGAAGLLALGFARRDQAPVMNAKQRPSES